MLSGDNGNQLEEEYEQGYVDYSSPPISITEKKGSEKLHGIEAAGRTFASIEDLVITFETVLDVNDHLNHQIEQYVKESDVLRNQIFKLENHCSKLSDMLREERRTYAIGTETRSLAACHADSTVSMGDSQKSQNYNAYLEEEEEKDEEEKPDLSFWWTGDINTQLEGLQNRGGSAGWIINPDELQMGSILGKGTFGTTFRSTWRGAQVAVKCVRIKSPDQAISFLREVDALSFLRHPNVMPFIGCCLMPPDKCWIVTEYMSGGTLNQWLYGSKRHPRRKRTLEQRLQKCLEVAQGMQCLGEALPFSYLHRDLKPTNVFIDGAGNARVGDFGLARRMLPDIAATLTGETGTYMYMSPEVIRHEVYDSRADVYSWGVMLAEMINYKMPYQDLYLTPIQVGLAVSDEKLHPTISSAHPEVLHTLLDCTTDFDPSARPNFKQIVQQLEQIILELFHTSNSSMKNQDESLAGMFGRMLKQSFKGGVAFVAGEEQTEDNSS